MLLEEVQSWLAKGTVEVMSGSLEGVLLLYVRSPQVRGRSSANFRASRLNEQLNFPFCRMEYAQSIRSQLKQGQYVVLLDMKYAHLHIPMHRDFWKYLRFCIGDMLYQFRVL